jgi:RNA polymerase sigma-70 factor (ECF subfamily)
MAPPDSPGTGRPDVLWLVSESIATLGSQSKMQDPGEQEHIGLASYLKSGAPDSIALLLRLHGREIQAVAYGILRDREAARDVAAETIAVAWEKINSLRDSTSLRPWLLSIAAKRAITHLRRSRRALSANELPAISTPSFEAEAVWRISISEAMAALPPQMRVVVTLRYVADLSIEDIGRALHRSRNTVKSELRVALQRLRTVLAESGRGEQ